MSTAAGIGVCALLPFVISCDVVAETPDLADKVRDARERMHRRFETSGRVQHAIALGQLQRAQAEARTIDSIAEPEILPEWRDYIDRVRAAARNIVAARDTVAAARSSALMGRECARCHEASKARIVFAKPTAPPPGGKPMLSHDWATARMWEGLIAPDDERWTTGAKRLVDAKLEVTAEAGSLGIADDVARVRLLGRRAIVLQPQHDRMQLYGELLGTCARCHFTIRD